MKKIRAMIVMTAFLAASLGAQSIAPNEVRVFKHADFIGDSASFKVESGMRHKLVPYLADLDNVISSVLIGSDVVVMAFDGSSFESILPLSTLDETRKVLPDNWNDCISSLVVFWKKDIGELAYDRDPFGIYLIKIISGNRGDFKFVPLPEDPQDVESRHALLTAGWDDQVSEIMMGRKVEVTLFEDTKFQGESLYLPGASPNLLQGSGSVAGQLFFALGKYEFADKTSSLIVRVFGAPSPTPEREGGGTGTVHRAPPAGGDAPKTVQMQLGTITVEPISIAGSWKSNVGLVYEIAQNKDKFTWKIIGMNQVGEGTITGDAVSVTWTDPKGRGGAKGKIILDRDGKAVRIEWSNGVIFRR